MPVPTAVCVQWAGVAPPVVSVWKHAVAEEPGSVRMEGYVWIQRIYLDTGVTVRRLDTRSANFL